MMSPRSTWFATFPPGFGPLARRLVERDVPGAGVLALEDNAVRFASEAEPAAILAYCRSLFLVLGEVVAGPSSRGRPGSSDALGEAAALFARDRDALGGIASPPGRAPARGSGGFTLRAFGPDDPAPLPEPARRALEAAISRSGGGRSDPRGDPRSREFRLQERSDGTVLLLERRAQGNRARGRPEPPPRPGELPRTTCRLLAEMTEPRADDVFLDPFCGYGGIALERALAAPYRFAFATDLDGTKIEAVKEALRERSFERRRRTFFPKVRDALDGAAFEAGFVGAIATDPPWGAYGGGPGADEADGLLRGFMGEAARLLGPGGRLVLLVGRDQAAAAAGAAGEAFALAQSLDVLISGKKASVLRFDRKS
jgi:SAM-dependent methyltransferase